MAQVIECLPSKCEALSSNPNIEKKKSKTNNGGAWLKLYKYLPRMSKALDSISSIAKKERKKGYKFCLLR
jgi:hypothetical protein